MEQHFIVAVKAIIPLFLLIGMGIFVRWRKMLTDTELKHVNAMIFRVFFFCMMFYNMYTTTIATALRPRLLAFTVAGLFTMLMLSAVSYGQLLLYVSSCSFFNCPLYLCLNPYLPYPHYP